MEVLIHLIHSQTKSIYLLSRTTKQKKLMFKRAVDLSFAGCGFLGTFHVGSYAAFKNSDKGKVLLF